MSLTHLLIENWVWIAAFVALAGLLLIRRRQGQKLTVGAGSTLTATHVSQHPATGDDAPPAATLGDGSSRTNGHRRRHSGCCG